MGQETVIRLSNVSKTFKIPERNKSGSLISSTLNLFGASKKKVCALKNISFEVKKGSRIGVVGNNGSGKSTLIKLILGSLRADYGGKVVTKGSAIRLTSGLGFDKDLTAEENIRLSCILSGVSQRVLTSDIENIIKTTELSSFKNTPIKYFSKGMKTRLALATAILVDPDILLLDEFFGSGGDIKFKKISDRKFKEQLLPDKTLVIVSHSLSIIKKYCTEAIWLHQGEIQMFGSPDDVVRSYKLNYGIEPKNLD